MLIAMHLLWPSLLSSALTENQSKTEAGESNGSFLKTQTILRVNFFCQWMNFFLQIANKPCSKVSGAWRSSANDDLCSMLFLICERSARYPWIRLMLSFICWKNNVRSFTFSKLNCRKPEFGDWTITSPSNNVYTFNYSFPLKISVACLCNDCIAFSVTHGNERKWKTKCKWSFL